MNPRRCFALLLCAGFLLALPVHAAVPPLEATANVTVDGAGYQLTGLTLEEKACTAWLSVRIHGQTLLISLAEGERKVLLPPNQEAVEVARVDPASGAVSLRVTDKTGQTNAVMVAIPGTTGKARAGEISVSLSGMPVEQALKLYSQLTPRTMLRPAMLQAEPVTLNMRAPSPVAEAANAIKTSLELRGLLVENDGDKFALVIPTPMRERVAMHLPPKPEPDNGKQPMSTIVFKNMYSEQMLIVYASYSNTKARRGSRAPSTLLTLESVGKLSASEAVYALEVSFLLNGLQIVHLPDGAVDLDVLK